MARLSAEQLGLPRPVVGWIYNHAGRNFWRIAAWYELDDLINDGLAIAYKCQVRYGVSGESIDPPHFMSLVKRAFHNHIGDLLRSSRPEGESVVHLGDAAGQLTETEFLDRSLPPEVPAHEIAALVDRMPETLRRAVRLYLDAPEKLRGRTTLDGADNSDRQLRKYTGFPRRFDFETELRAYLWEAGFFGESPESA